LGKTKEGGSREDRLKKTSGTAEGWDKKTISQKAPEPINQAGTKKQPKRAARTP